MLLTAYCRLFGTNCCSCTYYSVCQVQVAFSVTWHHSLPAPSDALLDFSNTVNMCVLQACFTVWIAIAYECLCCIPSVTMPDRSLMSVTVLCLAR